MFHFNHTRLATMLLAAAFTATVSIGCSTTGSTVAQQDQNQDQAPTAPDAREAVVMSSGSSLGASDALGHQLFAAPVDDTRFASAQSVYEMASAESGTTLRVDPVDFQDEAPTTPRQVIVSGEPVQAGPDEATATGEVNLFE